MERIILAIPKEGFVRPSDLTQEELQVRNWELERFAECVLEIHGLQDEEQIKIDIAVSPEFKGVKYVVPSIHGDNWQDLPATLYDNRG